MAKNVEFYVGDWNLSEWKTNNTNWCNIETTLHTQSHLKKSNNNNNKEYKKIKFYVKFF